MKTEYCKVRLQSPSGQRGVRILPVFLPFAGCPFRCVFCAQDKQTGRGQQSVDAALAGLRTRLQALEQSTAQTPVEVAFYGGTFTCLPLSQQRACLDAVAPWRERGLVGRIRCSTRPDAVSVQSLRHMRELGLELVELGIQSFEAAALRASGRGYDGETARQGCATVQDAGLELGMQLLPGLPGGCPAGFLDDVARALELGASCLRFYPCLVVEGTPLATLWRQGAYAPWDLDTTVATLAQGLALAWSREVPVIRLSLAPEPELEAAVLAGPRHPALGNQIQSEALWLRLAPVLRALPLSGGSGFALTLPAHCQGMYAGHRGALLPRWAALGVRAVRWLAPDQGDMATIRVVP